MGQCNTQPDNANANANANANSNEEMFRQLSNEKWKVAYTNLPSPKVEARDAESNSQRRLDIGQKRQDHHDVHMSEPNQLLKEDNQIKNRIHDQQQASSRQPYQTKNSPRPISNSSIRDASQDPKSTYRLSTSTSHSNEAILPLSVPDGAVRTRCYRLNLDIQGVVSPTNCFNGPFECEPTNRNSKLLGLKQNCPYDEAGTDITTNLSAETSDESDKQVAIKTAQIFRDLVITDDGNIISTNPRANRGSSKSKAKTGEKSRQAAKIDKAKDLIDEVGKTDNHKMDDSEKSNMISLVVLGEYDDMKCLVIEGASTLKDNSIPDEALLRNNIPRRHRSNSTAALMPTSSLSSNLELPLQSHSRSTTPMRRSGSIPRVPQSCPPKIKGHPRDLSRSRKPMGGEYIDSNSSNSKHSCNDLLETFLNCGTTGKSRDSRNAENSVRGKDFPSGRFSGREGIQY